ncbi:lactonase family protein [Microbispora rosea]
MVLGDQHTGHRPSFRSSSSSTPACGISAVRTNPRGPHPDRQEGPHAHQAVFGPGGVLYVTDLGTDEMRRFLPGMRPHPDGPVRLASGSGPRHFLHHDGHWYVTGELDGTVRVYDGEWREASVVRASGAEGDNLPAHIALSADGRHLYVTNRGPDTVSVFEVDGPRLTMAAEVPSGGSWPRHFAIDGDRLYVANQRSDSIAVLALKDGLPGPAEQALEVGTPSCVLIR